MKRTHAVFTGIAAFALLVGAAPALPLSSVTNLNWSEAAAKVKKIDIRNASEENRYFIVFCARGESATGHAFVVLGMEDESSQSSKQVAFGLHPVEKSKTIVSAIGTVPGEIVDEVRSGSLSASSHQLIVEVNSSHYQKAMEVRNQWVAKGEYKLLTNDCVSFIREIAKEIGLKYPTRFSPATMPQKFVHSLMEMNG